MILIITEEIDVSTIEFINWLNFYKKKFIIVSNCLKIE
jgi:hypothetical protein